MSVWRQMGLGALVLGICVVIHVTVLGFGIDRLNVSGLVAEPGFGARSWIALILIAAGIVLTGHIVQVGIWALAFRRLGALSEFSEAVYFALVTTTTLGYGDVTLDQRFRVFGAMAAVAGLMTYGLSTTFLVGVATGSFSTFP